jgi:anti-sigma factor RsiW
MKSSIQKLISRYLDKELTPQQTARLMELANRDVKIASELARMEKAHRILANALPGELRADPAFAEDTLAKIKARTTGRGSPHRPQGLHWQHYMVGIGLGLGLATFLLWYGEKTKPKELSFRKGVSSFGVGAVQSGETQEKRPPAQSVGQLAVEVEKTIKKIAGGPGAQEGEVFIGGGDPGHSVSEMLGNQPPQV